MIRGLQLIIGFCFSSSALSGYADIRLSGGSDNSNGKLEFKKLDGNWTSVCLFGFDDTAATVACRQLGYDHGLVYFFATEPASTTDICEITCSGYEQLIVNCGILQRLLMIHPCYNCLTRNDVVGISCSSHSTIKPTINDNTDHMKRANGSGYSSTSTSTPGIIAGVTGGVAAIMILVAFLFSYLMYGWCSRRLSHSSARELRNDTTSELEPPPYEPPTTITCVPTSSNCSSKNTLSDPPPNYSSLH